MTADTAAGRILAAGEAAKLKEPDFLLYADMDDAEILDRVAERLFCLASNGEVVALTEKAFRVAAIYVQTRRKMILDSAGKAGE